MSTPMPLVKRQSSYHSALSQTTPLYLVIYNNEKLHLTPAQMREILTREAFKFKTIRMHLRKWNFRIEFTFDNKNTRNEAIDEIKKLKGRYGVHCYYYFERLSYTYALME